MTTIKDRVLQIADYYGVHREIFFSDLGFSYANFKGVQKKSSLNSDAVAKVLSKYPAVSENWLLSGEGEMLKVTETVPGTDSVEYWRNLVDYYARELKEKRKDCMEMREELIELKRQFIMLQDECKKKELHPGMQAQE
jgi:hypothetical protein